MPWKLITYKTTPKGHTGKYCAQNLRTGKLYCSKTVAGRKKMMELHERYYAMGKKGKQSKVKIRKQAKKILTWKKRA